MLDALLTEYKSREALQRVYVFFLCILSGNSAGNLTTPPVLSNMDSLRGPVAKKNDGQCLFSSQNNRKNVSFQLSNLSPVILCVVKEDSDASWCVTFMPDLN